MRQEIVSFTLTRGVFTSSHTCAVWDTHMVLIGQEESHDVPLRHQTAARLHHWTEKQQESD